VAPPRRAGGGGGHRGGARRARGGGGAAKRRVGALCAARRRGALNGDHFQRHERFVIDQLRGEQERCDSRSTPADNAVRRVGRVAIRPAQIIYMVFIYVIR